jgi:hypothetical protein
VIEMIVDEVEFRDHALEIIVDEVEFRDDAVEIIVDEVEFRDDAVEIIVDDVEFRDDAVEIIVDEIEFRDDAVDVRSAARQSENVDLSERLTDNCPARTPALPFFILTSHLEPRTSLAVRRKRGSKFELRMKK